MLGSYLGPGICGRYRLLTFKYALDIYKLLRDVLVLCLIGQADVGPLEEGEEGLDFRDFACLVSG